MSHLSTLFHKAKQFIPGGVNSPVRAFNGVGGEPVFMQRAEGAYIIDVDNNRYIDYVGSWGPMILGHSHPEVVAAVTEAITNGMSFGTASEVEVSMAQKICELMPAIEMVRMVNSGTEATLSAIRLARGFTGRDKILKFDGCYHGHSDSLLVNAGSGALTLGVPSSPGVPQALAKLTLTAEFNNLTSVEELFAKYGDDIAAIIVEPVPCNMNCILPHNKFLKGLRSLCDQYRSLLIFDEVITGFRIGLGGATEYYDVKPDLITLGKIIGGGMPVGAYGGTRAIMEHVAPLGPVYQAGTLSGNPLAMTAGLTILNLLAKPGFYPKLIEKTKTLVAGLRERASAHAVPLQINHIGGIFGLFCSEQSFIDSFAKVTACDIERFKRFFHGMLQQGIYFAPSAFESAFMSQAHGDAEIQQTLAAADKVFENLI